MNDLKYAFRVLAKSPAFTFLAILTLALGIGASAAIFSVLDAVLLRPMPYPSQERLVEVSELHESGAGMPFAEPNFNDLVARNHSFEAVAAYTRSPEAVAGGVEPVRTNLSGVSADFFRVLGVTPTIGRLFSPETLREEKQVAVVSYGFWKSQLEGRPNLEGTSLRFGNRSFAVIGVLPPQTEFPAGVDVWFPFAALYPPYESRSAHNFRVIARLRPAVSFEQAKTEVAAIGRALKLEHGSQTDAASFGLLSFRERFVRDVRGVLFVLSGAVGLLLAIACSNVANLLLVRAAARRKEVALRAALGASRARLVRQFIVEALLLTLAAGLIGTLLASWSVQLLVGAGLLGRSFQRLLAVDPGFRGENIVAMTVLLPFPEDPGAMRALAQFHKRLFERLESLPGVTNVGGTSALPMSGNGANGTFIEERGGKPAATMQELIKQFDALSPSERSRDADYRVASAGYFAAMGIPLIRGRTFQA